MTVSRSTGWSRRLLAFLAVALVLASCRPAFPERPVVPRGKVSASSRLIGCDQADERVQVTVSSHLDPSCTYHEGFDITASNVVLDCRGAADRGRRRHAPDRDPHHCSRRCIPAQDHRSQLSRPRLPEQPAGDERGLQTAPPRCGVRARLLRRPHRTQPPVLVARQRHLRGRLRDRRDVAADGHRRVGQRRHLPRSRFQGIDGPRQSHPPQRLRRNGSEGSDVRPRGWCARSVPQHRSGRVGRRRLSLQPGRAQPVRPQRQRRDPRLQELRRVQDLATRAVVDSALRLNWKPHRGQQHPRREVRRLDRLPHVGESAAARLQ